MKNNLVTRNLISHNVQIKLHLKKEDVQFDKDLELFEIEKCRGMGNFLYIGSRGEVRCTQLGGIPVTSLERMKVYGEG